ncbi:MAG: CRTAC1 family protein [Phycisphaerales bacterium]
MIQVPHHAARLAATSFSLAILASTASAAAANPAFSEQASAAGIAVTYATAGFPLLAYAGGACVGDFNKDGWQDLFVLSGGSGNTPDHLFINNGNGTFTDQAAAWGLTAIHKGKAVCAGDFDGDGWLDIYVCSAGPWGQASAPGQNKLYHNNGNGTFSNVAASAGVAFVNPTSQDSWACAFGDYDLDGDLDLFVGGFLTSAPSNIGNKLFRNNGNGTFTDVTASIGLFAGIGPVATLGVAFVDTDGDRYPELLLSGDFKGANFIGSRYFKNNGDGTFTDLTDASNTGDDENGMGQCRGDLDNDGELDWYVTSAYFPEVGWTGNKLYRGLGGNSFVEVAATAGCADGGYGWGTVAVDFNQDGWQDIAETNGDGAPSGPFFGEQSYLWINNGDGTFTEEALRCGFEHFLNGRALLNLDYDNDGDQDVVIVANGGPLALFRNDVTGPDANWLRVFLDTTGDGANAPNGFGAKVVAHAGALTMTRWIDGGSSSFGTSELSAHFGLGAATTIDSLVVEWPSGATTTLANIAANQTLTIASAAPACPADFDGNGSVDGADLGSLLGDWNGSARDLTGDGVVDGADLGVLLGAWGACG